MTFPFGLVGLVDECSLLVEGEQLTGVIVHVAPLLPIGQRIQGEVVVAERRAKPDIEVRDGVSSLQGSLVSIIIPDENRRFICGVLRSLHNDEPIVIHREIIFGESIVVRTLSADHLTIVVEIYLVNRPGDLIRKNRSEAHVFTNPVDISGRAGAASKLSPVQLRHLLLSLVPG